MGNKVLKDVGRTGGGVADAELGHGVGVAVLAHIVGQVRLLLPCGRLVQSSGQRGWVAVESLHHAQLAGQGKDSDS
jgi:hypothetical protein